MTTATDIEVLFQTKTEKIWQVTLFNCNCHTFQVVVDSLMRAIGCSFETGAQLSLVAHQFGSVVVYKGDHDSCDKVAIVLAAVGLRVAVS